MGAIPGLGGSSGGGGGPAAVTIEQSDSYTWAVSGLGALTLRSTSSSPVLFVSEDATSLTITSSDEAKIYFLDDGATVQTCTITGTPAVIDLTMERVTSLVLPNGVVNITLACQALVDLTVAAGFTYLLMSTPSGAITTLNLGAPNSGLSLLHLNAASTSVADTILSVTDGALSSGTEAVIVVEGAAPTNTSGVQANLTNAYFAAGHTWTLTVNGTDNPITFGDSTDDPAPNVVVANATVPVSDPDIATAIAAYINGAGLGVEAHAVSASVYIFNGGSDTVSASNNIDYISASMVSKYAASLIVKGASVTTS